MLVRPATYRRLPGCRRSRAAEITYNLSRYISFSSNFKVNLYILIIKKIKQTDIYRQTKQFEGGQLINILCLSFFSHLQEAAMTTSKRLRDDGWKIIHVYLLQANKKCEQARVIERPSDGSSADPRHSVSLCFLLMPELFKFILNVRWRSATIMTST